MGFPDKIVKSENAFLYGSVLIQGTKISVGSVLRELSKGIPIEAIAQAKPEISSVDIYACLEYAAELVDATEFGKAKSSINANIAKRRALADRIRSLGKGNRPDMFK